jgi:hypothetical protein
VRLADGRAWPFTVEDYRRQCLLEGLDDIGVTLKSADAIRAYEARSAERFPWLFATGWAREPPRTAAARRLHRAGNRPRGAARVAGGVARSTASNWSIEQALIGGAAVDAVGDPLPDGDARESAAASDAILLGAVGGPKPTTTCRGSNARSAACCVSARSSACSATCVRRSCTRSWSRRRA